MGGGVVDGVAVGSSERIEGIDSSVVVGACCGPDVGRGVASGILRAASPREGVATAFVQPKRVDQIHWVPSHVCVRLPSRRHKRVDRNELPRLRVVVAPYYVQGRARTR